MLGLKDLAHLPQIEPLIGQLIADGPGLVVGDVSDEGMPAVLYVALTRSLILAEARSKASPRAVQASVHRPPSELSQPGRL